MIHHHVAIPSSPLKRRTEAAIVREHNRVKDLYRLAGGALQLDILGDYQIAVDDDSSSDDSSDDDDDERNVHEEDHGDVEDEDVGDVAANLANALALVDAEAVVGVEAGADVEA